MALLLQLKIFFSLACMSLLQTPCYSTFLSLYWRSSGFVCETWDRDNRGGETDESNCQRRQGKGRFMRGDEVKEWRSLSSFFIRASFAIMCPSSKCEIAQFMEEFPSLTWDNHVSSIQQPALFSEAGSSPKSQYCFQQYCKISITKLIQIHSSSTTTNTKLVCVTILDGFPPFR